MDKLSILVAFDKDVMIWKAGEPKHEHMRISVPPTLSLDEFLREAHCKDIYFYDSAIMEQTDKPMPQRFEDNQHYWVLPLEDIPSVQLKGYLTRYVQKQSA